MAHTFCAQHLHFVVCRLEMVGVLGWKMIVIALGTQASGTNKPVTAGPARPSKVACAVSAWYDMFNHVDTIVYSLFSVFTIFYHILLFTN